MWSAFVLGEPFRDSVKVKRYRLTSLEFLKRLQLKREDDIEINASHEGVRLNGETERWREAVVAKDRFGYNSSALFGYYSYSSAVSGLENQTEPNPFLF